MQGNGVYGKNQAGGLANSNQTGDLLPSVTIPLH